MEILILTSSHRKNGNSNILAQEVNKGASKKGHSTTTVDLSRLTINGCRDCGSCEAPKYNGCIIKDDMVSIYPQLIAADTIILASPIYWCNINGQLKQCIDRWKGIAPDRQHNPFQGKKIGAVFSYGDTDVLTSGCVNAIKSLQDLCEYAQAEWLGAVYGTAFKAGEVLNNKELLQQAEQFGNSL